MPVPPPPTNLADPTEGTQDFARAQSWALVNAKYSDAAQWANWGATIMADYMNGATALLGTDTVQADLAALLAEIGTISDSAPGTISGVSAGFDDALLTSLKARLQQDIVTYSSGLGAAEQAMFDREFTRVQAATAKAHDEVTTMFSSKGWDMPPGAMDEMVAEASTDAALRLTDSSGKILEESVKAALQYNISIVNASTQLLDVLSKVYESEELRKFEASKATVMLAVENYKSYLGLVSTKADVSLKKAQMVLENKSRQLQLEVQTMTSLAQGAQQIVASALNGVSSSASFGWSGSASTSYKGS